MVERNTHERERERKVGETCTVNIDDMDDRRQPWRVMFRLRLCFVYTSSAFSGCGASLTDSIVARLSAYPIRGVNIRSYSTDCTCTKASERARGEASVMLSRVHLREGT